MSSFPLIKQLGLIVYDDKEQGMLVDAADLERALERAPVAYGNPVGGWVKTQDTRPAPEISHTARLVCITPIKKKTKAEAALEFIKKCKDGDIYEMHANEVMKEAKRILEMKDEV